MNRLIILITPFVAITNILEIWSPNPCNSCKTSALISKMFASLASLGCLMNHLYQSRFASLFSWLVLVDQGFLTVGRVATGGNDFPIIPLNKGAPIRK